MIRFENVGKTYPRSTQPALRGISLDIERGEFVFVVGQSGSGKSTLLRLILREERATVGSVLVAGRELSTMPSRKVPELRREIGTVFQGLQAAAQQERLPERRLRSSGARQVPPCHRGGRARDP